MNMLPENGREMLPDVLLDRMALLFQFGLCLLKIAGIPDHDGIEDEREGRGSVELCFIAAIGEASLAAKEDGACHRMQGFSLVESDQDAPSELFVIDIFQDYVEYSRHSLKTLQ